MMKKAMARAELSRLLMQHRTTLYGYILACVRNHADAEDIVQNVCTAVAESMDRLQHEEGFLPWAREIARRRVLAHFRQARREQAADPELVQRLAETAERLDERQPASEHQAALLACLENLPRKSRRLILMRYNGNLSGAEELARRFGRSVQAVYALVRTQARA